MEMKVYKGCFAFNGVKIKYLEFRKLKFSIIIEYTINLLVFNKHLFKI